jgi:glycosyltransferase involved in cell wall biosynthesis
MPLSTGPMRIAITADPMLPVPPREYGGIERVVDMLVRGLVARGHEVVLFAHADSDVPCRLVSYRGRRPRHAGDVVRNTLTVARLALERPDLVHSFGRLAYLAPLLPGRLPKIMSYQRQPSLRQIRHAMGVASHETLSFTGCSAHIARQIAPFAPVIAIHNGVSLDKFTPAIDLPDAAPLVFLGRLERIKGVHTAIRVAQRSGRDLVIAGNVVDDAGGRQYYETEIAPHVDGARIRYVGPVDDRAKNTLLARAAALLMPVEWEEPFGIVMIEALACGTPVLGFRRGAVPEVIGDGVTGFLCDDADGMVRAVARLSHIDRSACRADCEARFSADVIVDAYERLYRDRIAAA